jgi:membrane protease YdiL (CAAX protease family)
MATAHASGEPPPETGAAPSLGLVLAGVALAASFLPWTGQPGLLPLPGVDGSTVAAALAGIAVLTFAARRYGALDRTVGAPVAGLLTFAVALVGIYRLVVPALGQGSAPSVAYGLPIATLAGLFGVAAAVADWQALPDDRLWGKIRSVAIALGIGFLAFLLSSFVALVPAFAVRQFGQTLSIAALVVGSGVGLLAFAYGYLQYRDLDWSYVDIDWPDLEGIAVGIGGLVVLYLMAIGVSVAFTQLGLPTATSSIEELAQQMDRPVFLLALVPLSWLVIGPGEELVYRNIVQKYLYEHFSRRSAVIVASVVFAAVHFQQYSDPNPVAMLSTLSVVFVLSLVLGYSYYRTENLLVPIFIHGTFNAIQFAALYFRLTGAIPAS